MAEYYPLLAKAVGRLPNSTPEARRVVYERARKALIGQLRTQHPPVPDEDIDRESVALDRAVERLEAELASGGVPAQPAPLAPASSPPAPSPNPAPSNPPPPSGGASRTALTKPPSAPEANPPQAGTGAIGPAAKRPIPPLRTRAPSAAPFARKGDAGRAPAPVVPVPGTAGPERAPTAPIPPAPPEPPADAAPPPLPRPPSGEAAKDGQEASPPILRVKSKRTEGARPIAPQPQGSGEPKRRLWIIPLGVGVVVALVAVAAWKLRDRPETIARTKQIEKSQADAGKIAERVGGAGPATEEEAPSKTPPAADQQTKAPATKEAARPQKAVPQPNNPEIPVAHRAALLVEAPSEPNKVKTFLGTVVWKLINVPQGAGDAVGLAVQAEIELPDDKMKALVSFEKNADSSLAASHTIKVQFTVEPGSYSGSVKQISTPQMRPEASPSGEALAGVTVPVVPNTFLVGLSPGNAEAANIDLMRRLQWVDIPMLLDNGKIAKLTFEKSDSGQRDLNEAITAWQK